MTDTTDEPQTAGGGSPEISPRTERLSDQTSEPQAPPAAPPKTPIGIGGPPKPPGGGRTLAMRIGILVVGLLLLGTLFVAASTLIRRHNPSPTPNPSPTSGQAFFTHSDPKYEYSIKRPEGWNTRNLTVANPNIALVVGPDPPYPVDDVITVQFHSLDAYYAPTALVPFKDAILKQLGPNVNIVTQNPSPVISGLVGYYFGKAAGDAISLDMFVYLFIPSIRPRR